MVNSMSNEITTINHNKINYNTLNVDPAEIKKFSAMAEQWWDIDGNFKPLHMLNPTRLSYIEQGINGLFAKRSSMLVVEAVF